MVLSGGTAISGGKFGWFTAGALSSIAVAAGWWYYIMKVSLLKTGGAYGAKSIHHAGLETGTGTTGMRVHLNTTVAGRVQVHWH
jgi:hypothetical protein